MNVSDVTPFAVFWLVLGCLTGALALYRMLIAKNESDTLHLAAGEEKMIPQQAALATRLAAIDRWGKILTVATLVVGVGVAASYILIAWNDPTQVPNTFYRR
jgi:hypothetical protein